MVSFYFWVGLLFASEGRKEEKYRLSSVIVLDMGYGLQILSSSLLFAFILVLFGHTKIMTAHAFLFLYFSLLYISLIPLILFISPPMMHNNPVFPPFLPFHQTFFFFLSVLNHLTLGQVGANNTIPCSILRN